MTRTAYTVDPACGLDPRVAAFQAAALDQQAVEFARDWGITYVPVVYYSWDVLSRLSDDEVAAFVKDSRLMTVQTSIDEPDALGFHTDIGGVIFARNLIAASPTDCTTPSHERNEMDGDPTADVYMSMGNGNEQALEASDRVEGDRYIETAVIGSDSMPITLSNYLLPSAFVPGSAGPWDRMGRLTRWDEVRPGGYEIIRDAAGNERNVFARIGRVGDRGHETLTSKLQRVDSRVSRRLRGR